MESIYCRRGAPVKHRSGINVDDPITAWTNGKLTTAPTPVETRGYPFMIVTVVPHHVNHPVTFNLYIYERNEDGIDSVIAEIQLASVEFPTQSLIEIHGAPFVFGIVQQFVGTGPTEPTDAPGSCDIYIAPCD